MTLKDLLQGSKLRIADLGLIAFGVFGSFALRLNLEQFVLDYIPAFSFMLITALIIKPYIYTRFGLYRRLWAYASIPEMSLIIRAVFTASSIVAILVIAANYFGLFFRLPRSVLVIDWLASMAFVGGLRFALRVLSESGQASGTTDRDQLRKAIIVGAGSAGALVVREMRTNPKSGILPVAFLDDSTEKIGQKVHDVEIMGTTDQLAMIAIREKANEVIFAIPSASGDVLRRVAESCRKANIAFRTMPGIYELIGGTVSVNRLREVDITDLLRRKPAEIDRKKVADSIRNKKVLITGAGGSIAGELCRQIARWDPRELILIGHGENSIFEILLEISSEFPKLSVRPYIVDIRDKERINRIMAKHKPDILFHAAAHKHVPLMEINISEAVTNNIMGTKNIVEAALKAKVDRLVMISTDKAVKPSSVMGATKRIAEWLVLDAKVASKQIFSVVRFGNVLGSRGSVVPLFKKQIELGGPITVTHPDMERYFMTIPEAVHLVLQAFTFEDSGQTYMLNMGDPVRIADLAKDLITLSGLEPGKDIDIVFSELRPGEKLSEELWESGVNYQATSHAEISSVVEPKRLSGSQLVKAIENLDRLANQGKRDELLRAMTLILPSSELGQSAANKLQSLV